MATVAQLNRRIVKYKIAAYKGDGYIYFIEEGDHVNLDTVPASVYMNSFNSWSLNKWVEYVESYQ